MNECVCVGVSARLTLHCRHKLHSIHISISGQHREEFREFGVILKGFHGDAVGMIVGSKRLF